MSCYSLPFTFITPRYSTEFPSIVSAAVLPLIIGIKQPSQYNNSLSPLVRWHKNPKCPNGSLNDQFCGGVVAFLVDTFLPWDPTKQSPKLQVQEAKIVRFLDVILRRVVLTPPYHLDAWTLWFNDNPLAKSIPNAQIVIYKCHSHFKNKKLWK